MPATWPTCHIFLNSPTLIIFGEWWMICSSSLCKISDLPLLQWNLLGQTATSERERFTTFRELDPSQSSGCAGGLVTQSSVLVLPNHQHALKCGKDLVPETSQNLHILTRLSAWEDFIEFCRRESFKTPVTSSSLCASILSRQTHVKWCDGSEMQHMKTASSVATLIGHHGEQSLRPSLAEIINLKESRLSYMGVL